VGVKMVQRKLLKLLESEGVKPIEALGKPFDPRYHEAVFEVDTKDHPDGYVMDELRSGFTYNDRILRASMVKVARNTSSESEDDEDE
jgi:molecular chaperone GrpE